MLNEFLEFPDTVYNVSSWRYIVTGTSTAKPCFKICHHSSVFSMLKIAPHEKTTSMILHESM